MEDFPVEKLRSLVDLNFCDECKVKYKQLIEPGIKNIISKYFKNWVDAEVYSLLIIMRNERVYKTSVDVFDIDDADLEKYADTVDMEKYKSIRREYWNFKDRIDYLKEKDIAGPNTYKLLDGIRNIRNKIHNFSSQFSERNLALFSTAAGILQWIYIMSGDDQLKEHLTRYTAELEASLEKKLKSILAEDNLTK